MQSIFASLFIAVALAIYIVAIISVIYHAPDEHIDWDQIQYTQGFYG
jgi:hypothetical protein